MQSYDFEGKFGSVMDGVGDKFIKSIK